MVEVVEELRCIVDLGCGRVVLEKQAKVVVANLHLLRQRLVANLFGGCRDSTLSKGLRSGVERCVMEV